MHERTIDKRLVCGHCSPFGAGLRAEHCRLSWSGRFAAFFLLALIPFVLLRDVACRKASASLFSCVVNGPVGGRFPRVNRSRRHASASLPGERNCGRLDATLSVQRVAERSKTMPETGQTPIRVYEDHDVWHVDYGEGVTRHYDEPRGGRVGSRRGRAGRRARSGRRGIATRPSSTCSRSTRFDGVVRRGVQRGTAASCARRVRDQEEARRQ